jgi:hypothetical protein
MIRLAFRLAASTGNPFSELISKVTGSPYSHVEGWLSGPQNNAKCFSSREPHGAGFQQIDLTVPGRWEITEPMALTGDQEALACGYCLGCDGKNYDGVGLVGFAVHNPAIHDYSSIFCSETWAAIAQHCWSKTLPVQPWQISPGLLFELAKGWISK